MLKKFIAIFSHLTDADSNDGKPLTIEAMIPEELHEIIHTSMSYWEERARVNTEDFLKMINSSKH